MSRARCNEILFKTLDRVMCVEEDCYPFSSEYSLYIMRASTGDSLLVPNEYYYVEIRTNYKKNETLYYIWGNDRYYCCCIGDVEFKKYFRYVYEIRDSKINKILNE